MSESTAALNLVLHTSDGDEPWIINQKIFDILESFLQSGTTLSATDAAKAIDELFPLNRPKEDEKENEEPASFLFEMWGVVVNVAEQIPWNDPRQDRLINIIRTLRDLPASVAVQMGSWGEMQVWADLPLLGPVLTETSYALSLDDKSEAQKAIQTRQQNFVAFTARLTKSGIADRARYFAIHYFREALEQEPDPRSKAYLRQGPQLAVYVPLAAIWIFIAGNVVLAHCRSPANDNDSAGIQKDAGRNWKGASGFSMERWSFWKKRFEEIKVHEQADETTRDLAAAAQMAMDRLETE